MAWSDVRLDQMRQDAASYADATCIPPTLLGSLDITQARHVHRAVCTLYPLRCIDVPEMQLWRKGSGAFQGLHHLLENTSAAASTSMPKIAPLL